MSLFGVAVENRRYLRVLKEQERARFGDRSWYRALDRALSRAYRWYDPFLLSRWAKRKLVQPRQDLIFGETPIGTAWHILNQLGVDQADHVVELGGGRGIFSLVAVSAFGSTALMLEVVPSFVSKTREVAANLGLDRLAVKRADILARPVPEGTVYFLTATTFSDASWRTLDNLMAAAPEGAKAVSLSLPLSSEHWEILEKTRMPFSWGENTVFFQTRRPALPPETEEPPLGEEAPENFG